jgi:hypothetical protein
MIRGNGIRQAERFGGAVIALAALSACVTAERDMEARFSASDHAAWMARGSAEIKGEAFIRRPNGLLAKCSGGVVQLAPASPYFREWLAIRRGGARIANATSRTEEHRAALRQTQCDQQGRFSFSDLPAGKWIVITRISYEAQRDSFREDAFYLTEVETKVGEVAKAVLSNPNRI